MKKLILAAAALLLTLPAFSSDADLSIPAEKKTIETGNKDDAKKSPAPAKKKKAYKKKERGTGYKFKAQDEHRYKFDNTGKPLGGKGKKAAAKKKSKGAEDSGYKFRHDGGKSSYRLDDEANPIGKGGSGKKTAAPKKPASKPAKKDAPPPYDDSLSVDKKVISLEGE